MHDLDKVEAGATCALSSSPMLALIKVQWSLSLTLCISCPGCFDCEGGAMKHETIVDNNEACLHAAHFNKTEQKHLLRTALSFSQTEHRAQQSQHATFSPDSIVKIQIVTNWKASMFDI